jgi:microcompartment protein CcmL/EutN
VSTLNEQAAGILEVLGFSVAMVAMDQAAKAADIKILAIDVNNPLAGDKAKIPNVFIVKFIGSIDHVSTALQVAKDTALKYLDEKDISTHMISGNIQEMKSMLSKGKVSIKTKEEI